MRTKRLSLSRVLLAVCVSVFVTGWAGTALAGPGTGASADVTIEAFAPNADILCDRAEGVIEAYAEIAPQGALAGWFHNGGIEGKAMAYAQHRSLKAYADIDYYTGMHELNCYSEARAWYTETLQVTAPEGFEWGDESVLKLAFDLDGTLDYQGYFGPYNWSAYLGLSVGYQPLNDPQGDEPMVTWLDINDVDENGLVHLEIHSYQGQEVHLDVRLEAGFSSWSDDSSGEGVADAYNTATFHSTSILQWNDSADDFDLVASFDGSDNLTAGGPGWAIVPEPATLGLLAIGGLALIRRRTRRT